MCKDLRQQQEAMDLCSEDPLVTSSPHAYPQVYKGRLRSNGKAVAVKVQRPGVREQIALDVYILRYGLSILRSWRKLNRWASS